MLNNSMGSSRIQHQREFRCTLPPRRATTKCNRVSDYWVSYAGLFIWYIACILAFGR